MKSENTHVKVVVFINKRIKKIMKGRKINKKKLKLLQNLTKILSLVLWLTRLFSFLNYRFISVPL